MMDRENLFKNIIDENKDRIYRICCYYVSDEEDRKDLYQDVLHNIWNGLKKFRSDAKISTWIYRVAVNSALAFLLKRRREHKQSAAYTDFIASQATNRQEDDNTKKINLLHKAIARLPLIDMIIISLVLEDAGSKEIAKVTGLTDSNVRVRIHRAKESLKQIINGDEL